jgi:hypothetical protein
VPGKLNLYNVGDLGVHLVETPIHSPDGSFTSAQNASVSRDMGQHGLRKRHGLNKLNTTAFAGAVLAIGNLPFTDPYEEPPNTGARIFANLYNEGPTASFLATTNGTTWSGPATSPQGWGSAVYQASYTQRGGVISTEGLITYLTTSGELHTFDGTNDTTLVTGYDLDGFGIQGAPALYDGAVVFATYDATSGKLLRQTGATYEELTTSIAKPAICVASVIGRVYIGTDENRIYYWSPTDGLVLDVTVVPTGGDVAITDIGVAGGVIYASAATKASAPTTHKVLKRTADLTWTDITPAATGDYGPLAVFEGNLYVARNSQGAFTGCEIHRYDGSSWTTDLTVTGIATGATKTLAIVAWNGALYASIGGTTNRDIIRRLGGNWTRVHTEGNGGTTSYYTAMGFY